MKNFEDEKIGNLIVGINYIENKEDFDIIKKAMKRIYKRLDQAAIDRMKYKGLERRNGVFK